MDVLEGALADVVEAGLIAMQEGEVGCGGQVGESAGNAADCVAGLAGMDGVVVEAGFDGPGAAHAPEGGGHFLDDAEFDVVGGAVAVDVLGQEDVEVLAGLGAQDDALGEKAVADGVEGRSFFPRRVWWGPESGHRWRGRKGLVSGTT